MLTVVRSSTFPSLPQNAIRSIADFGLRRRPASGEDGVVGYCDEHVEDGRGLVNLDKGEVYLSLRGEAGQPELGAPGDVLLQKVNAGIVDTQLQQDRLGAELEVRWREQ